MIVLRSCSLTLFLDWNLDCNKQIKLLSELDTAAHFTNYYVILDRIEMQVSLEVTFNKSSKSFNCYWIIQSFYLEDTIFLNKMSVLYFIRWVAIKLSTVNLKSLFSSFCVEMARTQIMAAKIVMVSFFRFRHL